ncbi:MULTISPECIES: hypothetical protein [Pseudomonas]|jgi:hypothetical protein|uniref:Uncharacterized protein n=1 Tax=Pseudomonas gorinensis TaxID=3240790 RepID=A0ACA7P438_9PSED|nr:MULTISPECIES: hypothetical protein [unclassified Pseudomonas]AHC34757.1 hypothetical protein U771_11142 [Pseudomonas sp. TKP]MBL1310279.1 hypothetical protein [Pseudomonas sp.]PMX04789.1 hypothetical protein C1Y25_29920 [Pseudomonas sp. MPBC4-3]PMX38603.1 hypothetical protein C1Y20_33005 [Pseudomonas sp. FW301-21B01]PMY01613.1 hypothetical protein C1Y18_33695 [Pseudomonas sp. MPR-R5A]
MKSIEIAIINNSLREMATIEYDRSIPSLSITFSNGAKRTYTDTDIFICFGLLRKEFSDITFLCKGSKINVYPSAMASQMSSGIVAYEVEMGDPEAKLVRIFDYEENELTNDVNEQILYRNKWAKSI